MTLEDLRSFVTAYEASSMSEAARKLGCTQAAVAQHVRKLENELGAELFLRMRKGVTPTEQGRTLYDVASSALAGLASAVAEIGRSQQRRQDELRLAVSTVIATRYLRQSMLTLRKRRPDVEIQIESENTSEGRLKALREGRADLAVVPLTQPARSLETSPFAKLELGLLVHREHAFAARPHLELADLRTMRYIAQSDSAATAQHVAAALQSVGISTQPTLLVEDAMSAALLVEIDRGETFVPMRRKKGIERSRRVKLVPVHGIPPLEMVWVARSFALLPAAAIQFMEIAVADAHSGRS